MKQTKHPTGYLHCPMFTFTTLMIKLSVCEGNVKDDDFRLSKRNAALKCSVVEHNGDFTSWQSRLRNLIFFEFFLLRSFDLKMHTNADRNRTWGDETGHESFQSDISYSQTQSSHSHWCYERVQREKGTGSCYRSQQTFQERFTGRVITSLKH